MTQKAFQNFDSNRLTIEKISEILISINSWLNYSIMIGSMSRWILHCGPFLGLSHLIWLRWPFLGLSIQTSSREIDSNQLMTHDSDSIPESWIDSTHDSNDSPGNWLRINSRLRRIHRYWFRSTHDSGGFPGNWLRINWRLNRITRHWFKSTHGSTKNI